jgi:hypothetical protein
MASDGTDWSSPVHFTVSPASAAAPLSIDLLSHPPEWLLS